MKKSTDLFSGFMLKGSFIRNLAILTGGSFVAYIIGFLFTPALTRIYGPEAYGYLSFFNTTLTIFAVVSSLGYRSAYILPSEEKKFQGLCMLVFLFSLAMASILAGVILLFGDVITDYFQVEPVKNWLYLIPALIIINAMYQMAESSAIRKKEFSLNAKSKVISVIMAKGSVLLLGLRMGSTPWGLISGELIIRLIGIVTILRTHTISFFSNVVRVGKKDFLRDVAREYRNYPLLIFPSSLLVQLTMHVPVYVIGAVFNVEFLGQYSLAISLLGIPVQVMGFSMGKVYMQKANETYLSGDMDVLKHQFVQFYYAILLVASLGYGILFAAGPEIFTFIAGSDWVMAGNIAGIMSFAFVFELVSITIAPIFLVMKKERQQLVARVWGSGIFIIVLIIVSTLFMPDMIIFVGVLTTLLLIRQLLIVGFAFHVLNLPWLKHLIFTLAGVSIFFLFYHTLSRLI